MKKLTPEKGQLVLNLCWLSAAEFALLERSLLPLPVIAKYPIEVSPRHMLFALAKTDTTVFYPCRASQILPASQNVQLKLSDFVLFTGDGDKIRQYWEADGRRLLENNKYEQMLDGLSAEYKKGAVKASSRLLTKEFEYAVS